MSRDENIQAVFDLKAGYTLGLADIEILKRVARMALAAMDSEPVIVVGDDGGDALAYRRLIQSFAPGTKLYRHAQPAPVVPDEINSASAPEVFEIAAEAERLGLRGTYASYAVGWNACRAAMLAAAPQSPGSEPATVPGKWIPVSEKLPVRGDYLVTDGRDFDVQLFNGEQFIPGFVWEDKITHWMPLPAAPQETNS